MANKIQIKRSTANATVTGLANGELAFTQASNTLHIGLPDGSGVLRIGGAQYPGTLTNSHALVANSIGAIDKVIVANLVVTSVNANGSFGTDGQVLTTNGSVSYWDTLPTGVSGSNTQVQFNDSGSLAGDAGLTFDKTTGTLSTNNVFSTSTVNASTISVGSSFSANTTKVTLGDGVGLSANGSVGSEGDVLISNGTSSYWVAQSSLNVNNALTSNNSTYAFGKSENELNVNSALTANLATFVTANIGIVSNSSGVSVLAGTGVTVNSTGVHIGQPVATTDNVTFNDLTVDGNTTLGSSSSDVISVIGSVNTSIIPNANVSYDIGSNLSRWANLYADNVIVTNGYFGGDVEIFGDLTVSGNVTTINVSSLSVSDPLIRLAANNTISDSLYIGFAGQYNGSGNATNHTGLVRDPNVKEYYLFSTYGDSNKVSNNEIDTSDPSFSLANLHSYLMSGGLVTNASHVVISSNSTVNVSITANTLTLSSPLSGTSGGTGLSSFNLEDILVGNSSNGFRTLALGTTGQVLQSNGSALVYDTLDGGTF